jgi:hypothetical protein
MLKAATVLLALSSASLDGYSLVVNLMSQPTIESRLREGRVSGRDRQEVITKLFADSGCQTAGVVVDNVGDDDTHPFLDKKISVISIHSLTR